MWHSGVLGWAKEELVSGEHQDLAKKRPASMEPSGAGWQGLKEKLNERGLQVT